MGFAFVAHALLVLALSAGIAWHSQPEPAFEAELWSVVPQAAAPRAVEPEPQPEPEPQRKPEPKPVVQEDSQQLQRDAQIAIEREKKKREEQLRKEEEQRREQERKRLDKEKADKAEKDKLEKQRQQQEAREKAREEAKREQLRQDNLKRMMGLAGASGGPGSTGTALQSSGPSASYAGRIKARIRPNIIFTDTASGSPVAEVEVRVAPDGTILGKRLTKPSGNPDWDAAVLRAIDRTETLPRDTDGRVPPVMVISFKYGE